jgi:hypothetical protein
LSFWSVFIVTSSLEDHKMPYNWLKIFENPIKFLKITGIWIDENTSKRTIVFVIIMHTVLIDFTLLSQFVHLMTLKKFREFTDTFLVFASFLSMFVETISLLANREKITFLMKELERLISFLKIDEKSDGRLKKRVSQVDKIFKVNFGMLAFLAVPGTVFTVTRMELPYSGWFPFDYNTNLTAFWILALIQTFGVSTYLIAICIEALPLFFISYLTGLMEELAVKFEVFFENKSYKIEKVGKKTKSRLDRLKTIELLEKSIAAKKNEDFSELILIHQEIKATVLKFNESYELVFVVKWMLTVLKLGMASLAIITVNILRDNKLFR